jgi:protoporphyrinogen IX oxidase
MPEMYLAVKTLHLISLISWMVGLLYLPRLYVYHADAEKGSPLDKNFILMEQRLYRYIMLPALLAVLGSGLWLSGIIGTPNLGGWFHVKLALLLCLFAFHGALGKYRRAFAQGKNTKSAKFFRWINEIPTILMVIIIGLAVIKPF